MSTTCLSYDEGCLFERYLIYVPRCHWSQCSFHHERWCGKLRGTCSNHVVRREGERRLNASDLTDPLNPEPSKMWLAWIDQSGGRFMQVKCWRVEDLGGTLGLSHGDVENPSDHCGSPLVVKLRGLTKWLHVAAGSLTSAPVSGIMGHICSAKVYQHPSTLTLLMLFHIHHSVQFIRSAWISHEVYVWCMLKSRSCLCQILW